ncbi:MAG: DUF6261 family protein [Tannerellaceae bacterium]|jgi:hypothetical protein|nr:DUF6261 family protein [Tannerellaceae bacterium]
MIKDFLFLMNRLRTGEHFDFYWSIIHTIEDRMEEIEMLLPLWKAFLALFQTENILYKWNYKSVQTRFLVMTNQKRIDAFLLFKQSVSAGLRSEDPATRKASAQLKEVTDNVKEIVRASYQEKTALIIHLLQKLEEPAYAAAVQTLSLAPSLEALARHNRTFASLYTERAQHLYGKQTLGTMEAIRPRVDKAFHACTEALSSLYEVTRLREQDSPLLPQLEETIEAINSYIIQYRHVLARRQNPEI